MKRSPIEIFGIRHHGPGSARSLVRALHELQPDLVLVEGPPDAEALIPLALHPDMQPPVAMLLYNPKRIEQASFFPFAEFSPEWQAILFAGAHHIPLRFMDLPAGLSFALRDADLQPDAFEMKSGEAPESDDPFREIALLAGYTDPERWWDAVMERGATGGMEAGERDMEAGAGSAVEETGTEEASKDPAREVFRTVLDLMRALREGKKRPESRETLLREAYMRQTIRVAQKEGFQRIAVVCGAWHGPALAEPEQVKASSDAAALKGLKKVKTEAVWIPWSFDRLSQESGYGAGVVAPAWYRILWNAGSVPVGSGDPVLRTPHAVFLTMAARLLRDHDLAVSSAHVIEAVRLAESLAVLRHTAVPGIGELREAAVTVLCHGAEKPLELIDRALVTGDVLGSVPANLPVPPLKDDFEKQARSCRLEKSTQEKNLQLDLREEAHLKKSRLLHRLDLLRIPWGTGQAVGSGKQGRFHEHWKLKWLPDFEIRLIEAGAWGNTVEDAAGRKAWQRVRDTENLPELTRLLDVALKADLAGVVPDLLQKLQHISALAKDVLLLADAVLPLAEILRYGHARQLDPGAVQQLLDQIVPRICVQLPAACMGIDEEAALDVLRKILAVNRALGIINQADKEQQWAPTLDALSRLNGVAPLLAGLATRLLFDKNSGDASRAGKVMRFRLSRSQNPLEAAQWLEGFLFGSGLLLLHHAELWNTLDNWVRELPDDTFTALLPLLRRTFSQFEPPERQKMLDLAKNVTPHAGRSTAIDWDMDRATGVLALVRSILQP